MVKDLTNTLTGRADAVQAQHLIALLVADAAAIGIWRNGHLLRHRVLTGYTVRKQQGKAQLSYQRQGGGGTGLSYCAQESYRAKQNELDSLLCTVFLGCSATTSDVPSAFGLG